MRRSEFVNHTMKIVIARVMPSDRTASSMPHHLNPLNRVEKPFASLNIILQTCHRRVGTLAMMLAKRIIEIPLPIPCSLIFSASHMIIAAPAQ